MSLFVALEGGEGVGKTTQLTLLKERLPVLFPRYTFVFTREPGGTPLADEIRTLILGGSAAHADGHTMFGLFIAARAEHVRVVIGPALEAGSVVVSDRYIAATYAYQVCAQEAVSGDFFEAYLKQLPYRPGLTIILDVDPSVALPRARARSGQDFTHFDSRTIEFHERVREGYRMFARRYGTNRHQVVVVPADRSKKEVHEELVAFIGAAL